jgi:hypothetical protein
MLNIKARIPEKTIVTVLIACGTGMEVSFVSLKISACRRLEARAEEVRTDGQLDPPSSGRTNSHKS